MNKMIPSLLPLNLLWLKRKLLLIILFMISVSAFAQKEPFSTIEKRISADLQTGVNDVFLAKRITKDLTKLKADGSWTDINYADAQYDPLKRIKEMAMAYIRPSNKFYGNQEIYGAINTSLQNWLDRNPKNKNWWYNDIFYPQAIGQTLILMRNAKTQLPVELEKALIQRMVRKLKVGDGANTSDEALHYLYRACLTQNKNTLDSAAKYLFEPIAVEDGKEGVQVDGSYYQHGKQQAIASYGRVFAGNSVNAAYYLRDTEYALPKAQLDILVSYLKDTFLKTIRGSFYDFNVRGRGISRQDSLNAHVSGMVNKIKMFNRENSAYWEASTWRTSHQKPANYQIEPSNTVYWKSGYTLQVRPQYTFSVQTASVKTLRTERGNNENVLGKFLSDGATNIQRSGSEYANIMPLWEWDKIPGTTSRDYADDNGSTIKKEWGIPGTTKFVGGVSDGVYGVSAYDLDYDSVQAKKAWFFFDKEVVCLGAGINSASSQTITTTINQSWLRGKVIEDKSFLLHDSIGYFFPAGGEVKVTQQNQVGNWYRINQFQNKKEVSGKVFKSWFNHGVQPHDASYAYVVVPGIGAAAMQKYQLNAVKIIQNTKDIQAVMHNRLSILQVVFYQGGALSYNGIMVKVDKPCIVQINDLNAINPLFFIADPTQENSKVQIEIKTPKLKSNKIITCNLPVGALAGSTIKYNVSN